LASALERRKPLRASSSFLQKKKNVSRQLRFSQRKGKEKERNAEQNAYQAMRMPLPPPPALALIMTGYPISPAERNADTQRKNNDEQIIDQYLNINEKMT
jgi:hypothetical protein